MVTQPACLIDREFDYLLRAGREADFSGRPAIASANDELNSRPNLVQFHAEVGEHSAGHTITLANEAKQQMLGADIVVV
jgi:2-keto-4-pentenoate hydratase